MDNFKALTQLKFWCQKVLPLVYDDSLSYYEVLCKVQQRINDLIENNNLLPDYIMKLIKEYISSGEIEKVLADVLANYMLNVKFPPSGLTPAKGDGTADDTQAIQGCIDYANANGGMAVYFPSGKYLTQSLNMKSNVTLFGFDRNTTHLVLKGGVIKPLLSGAVNDIGLTGLTFDGNADIQVNNVDLIVFTGGNYNLNNLKLTDGYNLLTLNTSLDVTIENIVFGSAVVTSLITTGNGFINASNMLFKSVSALSGLYAIENKVDNAVFKGIYSTVASAVAIKNTSNNSVFIGQILNATDTHETTGSGNFFEFYNRGGTVNNLINAERIDRENADNALELKIETEIDDRENADNALGLKIETEIVDRENADNALGLKIETEIVDRENADNALDLLIKNNRIVSVLNYGAIGDGNVDDTNAINDCIAEAKNNGLAVYFPDGKYKISQITLLKGVHIYGNLVNTGYGENGGSWFYPVDTTKEAILMQDGSIINGFGFYYPEQIFSTGPTVYKSTICADIPGSDPILPGGNQPKRCCITNCYFINPYIAIDFSRTHDLLTIENVQGYAIYKGVIIDDSLDSDTLINVHFNNNALANTGLTNWESYRDWTRNNGICFEIGRADWINLIRCFCWGYSIGSYIHKIGDMFPGAVRFTACGLDSCGTCALIEGDSGFTEAISFDNCMIYANQGLTPGALTSEHAINASNCRNLQISNCLFGNTIRGSIKAENVNTIINACTFNNVGLNPDSVAITMDGGSVIISNCTIIGENRTSLKGLVLIGCNLVNVSGNNFLLMANTAVEFQDGCNNISAMGNVFSTLNSASDFVLNDASNYVIQHSNKTIVTQGNINGNDINGNNSVMKVRNFVAALDTDVVNNSLFMDNNGVLKFKDKDGIVKVVNLL